MGDDEIYVPPLTIEGIQRLRRYYRDEYAHLTDKQVRDKYAEKFRRTMQAEKDDKEKKDS